MTRRSSSKQDNSRYTFSFEDLDLSRLSGQQSFHAGEKLKRRSFIQQLFKEGNTLKSYPLRLLWLPMELDSPYPAQFTVSVPRRNFKKAHDRNRVKRQLREIYRLSKIELYEELLEQKQQVALFLIYIANELPDSSKLNVSWQKLLDKLIIELKGHEETAEGHPDGTDQVL